MVTFKSSRPLLRALLSSAIPSHPLHTAASHHPGFLPSTSFRTFSLHPAASQRLDRQLLQQYGQLQCFTSTVLSAGFQATSPRTLKEFDAVSETDWDNLGFRIHETDQMFVMKCNGDGVWYRGKLEPYGFLELSPSAGILNYGQGVFEGLKAYRTEDGRLLLFRPQENAMRMILSADRLCMPAPSVDVFVEAVKQTVLANKRWIPPVGKGSLYIRPLLIGSGPVLGLAKAPEYTFLVYVSPVGTYFKEGSSPIHLKTESVYSRAVFGGTGGIKTICNYAPVLKPQLAAKEEGFSDVIFLDALERKYLEEVSSCNIFILKGNKILTPDTKGSILPGITRKCIVELAEDLGYKVEMRQIHVDELLQADEVFCSGTAVVVSSVGSITHEGTRILYPNGGRVSRILHDALLNIQMGKSEDARGWTMEV